MLPLQSEEIDKLTQAWVEAEKEIDGFGGEAKSNFKAGIVSIDDIRHATRRQLLNHGIKVKQVRIKIDDDVYCVTKVTHVSGQWEASYMPLTLSESANKALTVDQRWGISFSYQRRYELYGLFGIKGEELDPDFVVETISDAQGGLIKSLLKTQPEREAKLLNAYGITDISQLPKKDAEPVIMALKGPQKGK